MRLFAASLTLLSLSAIARAQDGGTAMPAAPPPEAPKPVKLAKKKKRRPPPPPLPAAELYALNTHETYHLRPGKDGRFTRKQLVGWNRFLRCHHTGRSHMMATRLAELVYNVDKHFEFKRVIVVAGYRAPRVAKEKGNPKSPHKKGVACDFRIEGVNNTELRDFARTLPRIGVGYYPNSDFVHLDVDPLRNRRSAFWVDYSRPGERARYSRDPSGDLEAEKLATKAEDLDDELAAMPGQAASSGQATVAGQGGQSPQAPTGKGGAAPNNSAALAPTAPNP